jgi:hypothetical protein
MLPDDVVASDELLRRAVRQAVESTSLRGVARELAMSPSGLQKFAEGATPLPLTRRKLERWYAGSRAAEPLDAGAAVRILRVLGHGLLPARRDAAVGAMLEALSRAHDAAAVSPPEWLAELRALPAHGAGDGG